MTRAAAILCDHCGEPYPASELEAGGDGVCRSCGRSVLEPAAGPTPAATEEPDDALVFGEFVLLEEIGRGDAGAVYRAHRRGVPDREVALKTIAPPHELTPATLGRLDRDLGLAARLRHPNAARIEAHGSFQGTRFTVSELLTGPSFARVLSGGTGPLRKNLRTLVRVARAVHHAHGLGVLHRDLKPGNVLFDSAGTPKVTDFALDVFDPALSDPASLDPEEDESLELAYRSPEQLGAEGSATARSDVYALGAILVEILTGSPPFAPGPAGIRERVQGVDPPPIRGGPVDAPLAIVASRALEPEPAHRYATAGELADDLERHLRGEPIRARRRSLLHRAARRWAGTPNAHASTAVAAVLAMAVVFAIVRGVVEDPVDAASRRADRPWAGARVSAMESLAEAHARGALAGADLGELPLLLRAGLEDPDAEVRLATLETIVAISDVLPTLDTADRATTPWGALERALILRIEGEEDGPILVAAIAAAGATRAGGTETALLTIAEGGLGGTRRGPRGDAGPGPDRPALVRARPGPGDGSGRSPFDPRPSWPWTTWPG